MDSRVRTLRNLVFLNLGLLLLLLVFGLAFDSAGAARVRSPLSPGQVNTSSASILAGLAQAGPSAFIHMLLGVVVGLLSILNMAAALRSGVRRIQVFGTLAFLSILAAGSLGLVFVASGFRDTFLLLGLVPLFILAVISYLLELFSLKALPRPEPG